MWDFKIFLPVVTTTTGPHNSNIQIYFVQIILQGTSDELGFMEYKSCAT
jgi:hypothetical protein